MTDSLAPLGQPTGTVGFERKLNLPEQYNSATASIFVQFSVDPENEVATVQAAKDAFAIAKATVYEQLGIESKYENGLVSEVAAVAAVREQIPGAKIVSEGPPQRTPSSSSSGVQCPKCGGPVWDNRESKLNARQPDYKCKKKGQCDGAIWLQK